MHPRVARLSRAMRGAISVRQGARWTIQVQNRLIKGLLVDLVKPRVPRASAGFCWENTSIVDIKKIHKENSRKLGFINIIKNILANVGINFVIVGRAPGGPPCRVPRTIVAS